MKRRALGSVLATAMIAATAAPGCRSHAPVVQTDASALLSNALTNGKTTQADVVLAWGIPAAVFESENILTYHLMQMAEGTTLKPAWPRPDPHVQPLAPWDEGRFDLILVFDRQQVLQRYSLVKVY